MQVGRQHDNNNNNNNNRDDITLLSPDSYLSSLVSVDCWALLPIISIEPPKLPDKQETEPRFTSQDFT